MSFRFENLEVWKLAKLFAVLVYKITRQFPKEELFGLTSQIRRAVISVVLNIVEGSDRKSDVDFVRFLRIAFTSLEEVVAGFSIALDLHFISQTEYDTIYQEANRVAAKLNALINSLRNSRS